MIPLPLPLPLRRAFVFLVLALATTTARAGDEAPRTVEDLLQEMEQADYQVRRKAVLAVAGRTEPALLEQVLALARTDPHPNIRGYAAQVLGTLRDERIFPLLLAMTRTESSVGPRREALVALGALKDTRAYDVLMAALDNEDDAAWAAKGLGLLGDARARPALLCVLLAAPEDPWIVDFVPEAVLRVDPSIGTVQLLVFFAEGPKSMRWGIGRALVGHPSARTSNAMIRHLDAPDADLRTAAVHVLSQVGGAGAPAALVALFRRSPPDRELVAKALARLGARETAPLLAGALADAADGATRAALAHALGVFGDAAALGDLVRALRAETEPLARVRLLEALGRLGQERALAEILRHLDDDAFTRQPMQLSRVLPFPWNVRVGSAALWAARTLLDGKPPMAIATLSAFPRRPPTAWEVRERPRMRTWWEQHEGEARYRMGE